MKKSSLSIIFFRVVFILLMFTLLFYVEYSEHKHDLNQQKLAITQQLTGFTDNVKAQLNNNIELVRGLAAYVIIKPELTQQEFADYAGALLSNQSNIQNVAASDAYIVTHLYPYAGNEKVFGMDYRDIKTQLPSIEQALSLQKIVVSGPLELVQGGQALIARMPIYKSNNSWGIISAVINYDSFINQLDYSMVRDLRIAIRGKDALGEAGDTFFGDEELFQRALIAQTMALPYGSWVIGAEPREGWVSVEINYAYWLIALMITAFVFYNVHLKLVNERLQQQTSDKLEKLAHYDSLTGLPNREKFSQELTHHFQVMPEQSARCAVLSFDLDKFKVINDSLGHEAGDQLLVKVSDRLRSVTEKRGYLARQGGDEFVLLVTDYAKQQDLFELAQEICKELQKAFVILHDVEVSVSTSVGIARFPEDAGSISELMRFADGAMYHAKLKLDHNIAFYTPSISEEANTLLTINNEIRRAVEHNEFELLLQPQIQLLDQSVAGAEVLIRWHHPEKGLLSPMQFIPLAESTGSIKLITQWVSTQVIDLALRWSQQGHNLNLSMNVSAVDLSDDTLLVTLQKLIQSSPSIARSITIEIVESSIVKNIEYTKALIQKLRALGFYIAIDDFGIEFSSLSYLSKLPVDVLKVDRAFVSDIEHKNSFNIVKSIIDLANNFELKVTAEGIENERQVSLLTKLGCPTGQGYLYSKPISISEFERHFLGKGNLSLT